MGWDGLPRQTTADRPPQCLGNPKARANRYRVGGNWELGTGNWELGTPSLAQVPAAVPPNLPNLPFSPAPRAATVATAAALVD